MRARRLVTPADVLVSVGVFAAFIPYIHQNHYPPVVILLGVLSAAVLLAKKRLPVVTLAASLLISGLLVACVHRLYPDTPAVLVALYAVGRYRTRGVAAAAAIATVAIGLAVSQAVSAIPGYGVGDLSKLGWVPVAVLVGAWVRTQRTYVVGAERRAARVERERDEETHRRVLEERVRISRELHDIVGHALMSIHVLSSVSSRLVDRDPEAGRDALRTIRDVSNSALHEVRSTLELLRETTRPLSHPERGLTDIAELVEQARRSGMPVTLKEPGTVPEMPAIVEFTVYRIVQESLTNVAKHAREVTEVTVAISSTEDDLDVTVTNDGAPAEISGDTGIGIQGMRERVTATGGRLTTMKLPDGGFRVHARLPLKEEHR